MEEETQQNPQEENKKSSSIWWVLLVVIIAIALVLVLIRQVDVENGVGDENGVQNDPAREVAENFYNYWLSYAEGVEGINPAVQEKAHEGRDDISQGLSTRMSNLIENFGDNIPFDPFICSGAIPNEVAFGESEYNEDNTRADIPVDLSYDNRERTIGVEIEYNEKDDVWRLDAVRCN